MKKIVLAATAFSLSLALAACGESATEEAATEDAMVEAAPVEAAPMEDTTVDMNAEIPADGTDPMADPAATDMPVEEAPAE